MKYFLTTCVLAIILTGCGGGGSSGKGRLKNNTFLGSLPAIYADFITAKKADEAKIDKLHKTGDIKKIMKEVAKIEKEAEAREAKFEADKKAEMAKITGKDIPFTCSEAFKNLNCEVVFVKFSDHAEPGIIASIVAKDDFVVSYKEKNVDDYEYIWYRVLAKDGSTIEKDNFFLFNLMWGNSKSFAKGQTLKFDGKDSQGYWVISQKPEKWVDFASIEFITRDEF